VVETAALHLHPADTGGALVSFDQMGPPDGWAWAGRSWRQHRHQDIIANIVGVELTSSNPDALLTRISKLVDRPMGPNRSIHLDAGRITIALGPAEQPDQLTAVEMAATNLVDVGRSVRVAGTDIRFVDASVEAP
jgi:hypothetical protein